MDKHQINHLLGLLICLFLFSSPVRPAYAEGGSLFFSPASESFLTGDNFSIKLMLDSASTTINAAQTTIYFPKDILEVVAIKKEGSIFSLWPAEPVFSNAKGEISFTGGLPNPGFLGKGVIIDIEFSAKKTGNVLLCFDAAKILANDGLGTDILLYIKDGKYLIYDKGAVLGKNETDKLLSIFSSTHPDQAEWYSNNSPIFQWNLNKNAKGTSYVLDKEPYSTPDMISEGLVKSKSYENIADGIWYFHLRQEDQNGWGQTNHYKIEIDTKPPEPFNIIIDNKGDPTNPQPNIYFETQDETSGIDKYRVKIDHNDFISLMAAQITTNLLPGTHDIIVRALDRASNIVKADTILNIEPIKTPEIDILPEIYASGDETLYLEGTALPNISVIISLKDGQDLIKQWEISSNEAGQWSFSSNELIQPGVYYLSVKAQDVRGAQSYDSEARQIEVFFNGLRIGSFLFTYRSLIIFLILIFLSGIFTGIYLVLKNSNAKKRFKKETLEAKISLSENFSSLEKELQKKIEMFDREPGFNEQEKKAYESIRDSLLISRQSIEKEINDIEKELDK